MRYFFIIWITLVTGCESVQPLENHPIEAPEPVTRNLLLQPVELNLALAKESNLLWMVRDSATGGELVSVERLLFLARQYDESGDTVESERLATKVTQIIELAWEQDRMNKTISPNYPETN